MNSPIKATCTTSPIIESVLHGHILSRAVCMNRFLPRLDPLAFMVYNIPVAPVSGKCADNWVDTKNYHWMSSPNRKFVIMTGTISNGNQIHKYKNMTQIRDIHNIIVFVKPKKLTWVPTKNTSVVIITFWILSIVFMVSLENPLLMSSYPYPAKKKLNPWWKSRK